MEIFSKGNMRNLAEGRSWLTETPVPAIDANINDTC